MALTLPLGLSVAAETLYPHVMSIWLSTLYNTIYHNFCCIEWLLTTAWGSVGTGGSKRQILPPESIEINKNPNPK